MTKKILVVSQYFYPEQFRVNDICEEWVSRGYEVTVLTGIPNYPHGNFYDGFGLLKKRKEKHKGINIIRLPIIRRGKNSIMLSLNYFSFLISGSVWAKFTRKKFDKIFIYEVSPMTQAIPGVVYAKKHKIPSAIYVMDLWPENFVIMSGIKSNFIIKNITKMVQYIYTGVDKIFISSPGFETNILDLGDYGKKIEYWPQYAEDCYKPSSEESEIVKLSRDKFNITFAGNIGYAQGLGVLPEVARKLRKDGIEVMFNLVGNGRYKEEMIKVINRHKLESYFTFFDPVNPEEIPKIMKSTDVALISLSKDPIFSLTIPAKIQSTLATGTPVLVAADGVLENIISISKCGLWGGSENVESLISNIKILLNISSEELEQMGKNGLKYSKGCFNKNKLLDEIDKFLEE